MKQGKYTQALIWMLIATHLGTIYGCTTTSKLTLSGSEIHSGSNYRITSVLLNDGQIIEFEGEGGRFVDTTANDQQHRTIVGTSLHKDVQIDPARVLEVRLEHKESSGAGNFFVGMLVGVPVGAGVLVLIAALSLSGR